MGPGAQLSETQLTGVQLAQNHSNSPSLQDISDSDIHFKGTTTTTDVDFFDSAFTFSNESIEIGCCARDTSLTNVTCGQGTSCTGQCSAIEASLCPSGNCTGNFEDCSPSLGLDEGEDLGKGRSYATLPSWVFNWCTHRCPVRYHPSCCFHPTCRRRRWKLCRWMNYLTGGCLDCSSSSTFPDLLNNFSGTSCPKPGSIPHGDWSCQMQEIPIPDANFLDGDTNTYPGE